MCTFSLNSTSYEVLNEFILAGCWSRYAKEHPGASAYNLKTLKDFMKTVAFGIDGAEDNSNSAQGTVCSLGGGGNSGEKIRLAKQLRRP